MNFAKRYEGTATVVVSRKDIHPHIGDEGGKASVQGNGKYAVDDDELDEIWEEKQVKDVTHEQSTEEGCHKDSFVVGGERDDEGHEMKRRRTSEDYPLKDRSRVIAQSVLKSTPAFPQQSSTTASPHAQEGEEPWGFPAAPQKAAIELACDTVIASGDEDLWSF